MPRDNSGNYTLPPSNPVASGTTITSEWANTTMADIANELTNSLSRDGQGGLREPLKFLDGTVIEPSITFVNEQTLGLYRSASEVLSMAGAGVQFARFTPSKQVEFYRNGEWLQASSVKYTTPRTSSTGSAVIPTGTTAEQDIAPEAGYLRFNTTKTALEVYTGEKWQPVGTDVGVALNFEYIATDGQTDFSGTDINGEVMAYTPAAVEVFVNGARLMQSDYTADDGVTVILSEGAAEGDNLQVKSWELVGLPDVVRKSGDTMTGTLVIDAATSLTTTGNVGIGTNTPNTILQLNSNGSSYMQITTGGGGSDVASGTWIGQNNADQSTQIQNWDAGSIIFRTNASPGSSAERMRIDSSGSLLVGKTATDYTVVGCYASADGSLGATKNGATLNLNRKTTDGSLINLYKDDAAVGSIGTSGGDVTIGTGTRGLRFTDSDNAIWPWNTSTNASANGLIDLGDGSEKFKDLYLSGGVYVGGTAAANYLDDYEEGTWTPIVTLSTIGATVAYTTRVGSYTKIGNTVNFQVYIVTSTWTHSGTSSHRLILGGLPFAPSTSPTQYAIFPARLNHGNTTGQHLTGVLATGAFSTSIYFNIQDSSRNSDDINGDDVPSGTNLTIWVSGSYTTGS